MGGLSITDSGSSQFAKPARSSVANARIPTSARVAQGAIRLGISSDLEATRDPYRARSVRAMIIFWTSEVPSTIRSTRT